MIRASDCPIACSAVTPSSSSAARSHDVIQPWPSVVTIASPAAAIAADARAGSTVAGWPSGVDIEVSLSRLILVRARSRSGIAVRVMGSSGVGRLVAGPGRSEADWLADEDEVDAAGQLLVDLENLPDVAVLPVGGLRAGILQLQAVLVDPLVRRLAGGDDFLGADDQDDVGGAPGVGGG